MSSAPHLLPLDELAARLFAVTTEHDASLRAFWARHLVDVAEVSAPVDRAILGGASADRIAWAFLAGYQAALSALVPTRDRAELAALCVTELSGAHPRAVLSELIPSVGGGLTLRGHKRWSTTVPDVERLYVVARAGADVDGRPQLRVAALDALRAGVRFVPMPPAPFVPELPHGEVLLEDVAVAHDELLPGDGYARYVKPFRTVEDVHVNAAVLAYLLTVARRHEAPAALVERLFAALVTLRALAVEDAHASATHLALAGLLASARPLVDEFRAHLATRATENASAENAGAEHAAAENAAGEHAVPEKAAGGRAVAESAATERARIERDVTLLGIAGKAREQRRANAWAALTQPLDTDPHAAPRVPRPA